MKNGSGKYSKSLHSLLLTCIIFPQ